MFRLYALMLLVLAVLSGDATAGRGRTLADAALEDACRLSAYTCEGVSTPPVYFIPLDGILGAYIHGSGFVLMDSRLLLPINLGDVKSYAILVHEMVHYLQDTRGEMQTSTSCQREAYAYAISNLLVEERGRSDLRRNNWRKLYGCE